MTEFTCKQCGGPGPKAIRRFICVACLRIETSGYHKQNSGKRKAQQREYRSKHREEINRRQRERPRDKEWWSKYGKTIKGRAKEALYRAVKRGDIIKPNYCTECFALYSETRMVHGHHEDYSKPLEVIWLCSRCHGARHRMEEA